MEFILLLIIAIGLAMDSVTVSFSCAFILHSFTLKNTFRIAAFMGFFQGLMPVVGWFLGATFKNSIESVDHWVAFIILCFLGFRMIYGYFAAKNDFKCFDPTSYRTLLGLAVATSIDALAVGVTMGLIEISLTTAALVIGLVSFILSFTAIYIGSKLKHHIKFPFELVGGIILIGIGTKILIEHLWFH